MLDDLRKTHDARPTDEERSWMDLDPVGSVARVMAVVGLAMIIGLVVSFQVNPGQVPHEVVSALVAPGDAP